MEKVLLVERIAASERNACRTAGIEELDRAQIEDHSGSRAKDFQPPQKALRASSIRCAAR